MIVVGSTEGMTRSVRIFAVHAQTETADRGVRRFRVQGEDWDGGSLRLTT
jgi:hypothetical protein